MAWSRRASGMCGPGSASSFCHAPAASSQATAGTGFDHARLRPRATMPMRACRTSFMHTSETYMTGWHARVHQQGDFVLLVTCHTKQGNSGTRRSPASTIVIMTMPEQVGGIVQGAHEIIFRTYRPKRRRLYRIYSLHSARSTARPLSATEMPDCSPGSNAEKGSNAGY